MTAIRLLYKNAARVGRSARPKSDAADAVIDQVLHLMGPIENDRTVFESIASSGLSVATVARAVAQLKSQPLTLDLIDDYRVLKILEAVQAGSFTPIGDQSLERLTMLENFRQLAPADAFRRLLELAPAISELQSPSRGGGLDESPRRELFAVRDLSDQLRHHLGPSSGQLDELLNSELAFQIALVHLSETKSA
jgi:hypothetical protein